jgi:hypothetical protein
MKKIISSKLLLFLLPVTALFTSCVKESDKKHFEVKTKTWYRVNPIDPIPVVVNKITYAGFADFPGGGTGTATYLGNCTTNFNQLVYGTSPEAPPAGSVAAPLTEVPGYFVTGAPLPLIQAGDFSSLAAAISSLHIPTEVYGKIINQVFYNKKGEAIFSSAITGSGTTFPISATVVGFTGKAIITGGQGKFKNAVGEIDYDGYFNVANANAAEYNAKGWIAY